MLLKSNVQNMSINNNYFWGKKLTNLGFHLVLASVIVFTTISYKQNICIK